MSQKRRVCLVGAGFIANVHAEVLRGFPDVEPTAVVDPNEEAARALAARWRIPHVYRSADQALAERTADCAHILVPPPIHAEAARPFIESGNPILIEKPLGVTERQCTDLIALAEQAGVVGAVNQNFIFHPAFSQLAELVRQHRLGKLVHLTVHFNVPLRQLAARQFGHWMFHAPVHILLEQAVHPLSQIVHLLGEPEDLTVTAGRPVEVAPGVPFHKTWQICLNLQHADAQLLFSVGQEYPFCQLTAVCDDGVAVADLQRNTLAVQRRTRWPQFADDLLSVRRTTGALRRQSWRNAADYVLSTLRLRPRRDPFFRSMQGSIRDFHTALDRGEPPTADLHFGRTVVALCERIAAAADVPAPRPVVRRQPAPPEFDIAVLGGTGFIGTHVVQRLVEGGKRVGVMARNVRNLPVVFSHPNVALIRGDVTRPDDVERGIGAAKVVINLAHGGGGGSWEEIRRAVVGSAECVAECCLKNGVTKLVHISSIAALYLGDSRSIINGETPPDPNADRRADYARAKALSERLLLDLHRRRNLPVCILRPGVVVGEGGSPFHSGLGFYNNDQHCLGWNGGDNPLPFVLVEDVADAIVLAAENGNGIGRCYNIVGDARLTAREYIDELARALNRPLQFHPQSAEGLFFVECGKWLVKRAVGRRAPFPSYRDLKSRGMPAQFDCEDAKRDLGWRPTADREAFIARGVRVYARRG